jgi:hypothetical protein
METIETLRSVWEYRQDTKFTDRGAPLLAVLIEAGKDGWVLIHLSAPNDKGHAIYTFARPGP